uniref:DNA_MISMATCH_REPAIR_2 domain-containing protein n=1 Tax=Angiostrongylus cantonensis TaxID=6313 RepID=A0A158P9A3_ANGCA
MKSKNFDTLLLFKVGKFYELYHMDAVIAVDCLGLTFMRGAFAHAGFPEAAYGKFADQLVSRGYKVARIEQTETPQQLEERNRNAGFGKDKVVRREICRVTTTATRTYAVIDGCSTSSGETDNGESQSKYLLSIKEGFSDHDPTYGICLVDTSVGKFFVGEFLDDDYSSYLRTLIANFTPAQVLFERGNLSAHCKIILNGVLNSVQKEGLIPKKQFLYAEETLKLLSNDKYLGVDFSTWPGTLRNMLDQDSIVAKPNKNSMLAISALGAVLYYLQRCLIDVDMITMRDFTRLEPVVHFSKEECSESTWSNCQMILDGITLENLNLIPGDNRDLQAASLSLYSTLNKCQTSFGKRMLHRWICSPICHLTVLKERQDAIEFLMSPANIRLAEEIGELLRKMPDLERLLQKIHTLGLKYRSESHPDGRAVLFEAVSYNKRKIKDLLSTLAGFQKLFDHSLAEKEGMIIPQKGLDLEYDSACRNVDKAMHDLEVFRKDQEEKVDFRRHIWTDVVNRVSQVDVLLSLARYCQTCGLALCRPEFVYDSRTVDPMLSIEEGYHPCLATKLPTNDTTTTFTYIANDSFLGGTHPPVVLLTGPNMGGKSTLMRQVAVLTVLAHMGSFVPARSMRLTPVDRIFTRIGANDRLICGQSTFFVELRETLIILRNATKHSLVLIDELGRGTSTFDGTAIASAVLSHLSRRIQCRSFFSTHYHSLCKCATINSKITLAHMACMVENEDETNPTEECVTFLYRLTDGVCPKSYGFFAARLAGVKPEVVRNAYEASTTFFDSASRKRIAIAAIKEAARSGASVAQLRSMVNSL